MSPSATPTKDAVTTTDPDVEHLHAHPSELVYIKVALVLAAVTLIEVGLYYWSLPTDALNNSVLIVLALIKFTIVAAYFMHLKFDNRILRRLFVSGFVLACFCYIAYMVTLGVFVG